MPYSFKNNMSIKIINTTLLVITLIGVVFAFRAGREYHHWHAVHNRLKAQTGSFRVKDPSKLNVRALETGELMHFAWWIYLPAGVDTSWQGRGDLGGLGYNNAGDPSEFIARMRVGENEKGVLEVF